ncbi:MAG: hypothetical protein ACYTG0_10115 [Planctomycetota bacterium]|jgi:hypothetical protein
MRRFPIAIVLGGTAVFAASTQAQVPVDDAKDRRILEHFLKHVARLPERIDEERCRRMAADEPEGYTWKILPQAEMALSAYRLTGDPKHLDAFAAVFAAMRAAMTEGPDGYLGWYGKALPLFRDPREPDKRVDVIISSFRTVGVLSQFLECLSSQQLVAAADGRPARFHNLRAEYIDLMENHLIKKWDERGCYVDLGVYGAVYRTHRGLKDVKGNLTQPHNKHSIILQALLALYRVTGKDEIMKKAVKLGTRFKHCLALRDGHYEWNYWDPAGPWDVDPSDPARWKHWIGPEHRSGYYSHSLTQAIVLAHHGLVFDETDVARFLKTQLEMTWNGDLENPQWHRVDRSRGQQSGAYICPALAPYHERVYAYLYTGARQDERLDRARHPWQGGPVANGWLRGKLWYCPAVKQGTLGYDRAGAQFLGRPENCDFCEALALEVTGAGYRPPSTPAEMKAR